MKIVHVITRAEPIGGAQVHVRDLSQALLQRGHQVYLLVGAKGLFTEQLETLGVKCIVVPHLVREIKPHWDWLALREISEAVKTLGPDLICTHSSKAGWLGRLAGKKLGIPTVFTAHGWAFTEGVNKQARRVYKFAEKLAAPLAAKIINVSDYDRRLALREGIAGDEKLVTVHNGVPDIPAELAANSAYNPPRLIMIARFQGQKDHATLIKALGRLRETPWSIDLVGDGPLRDKTEQAVSAMGLAEKVNFLGERKDIQELLARAQIFLLISNWEGLPLSILEAMRAKLPVIASDVGGVSEAVADGVSGFIVPRGDDLILVDRIKKLLDSPELRIKMGVEGRERYLTHFTVQHMVENTIAVYHDIMSVRT